MITRRARVRFLGDHRRWERTARFAAASGIDVADVDVEELLAWWFDPTRALFDTYDAESLAAAMNEAHPLLALLGAS